MITKENRNMPKRLICWFFFAVFISLTCILDGKIGWFAALPAIYFMIAALMFDPDTWKGEPY